MGRLIYFVFTLFLIPHLLLGAFTEKKASTFRPGKDYALFIAVADYESPSWPDLRNPIRDAEAVAKELKERYGFQTEILRNPSKKTIFQKLRSYSKKQYQEDAQLFIFFSGHGHYDEITTEGFFIPKDGDSSSEDPDGFSWVPHGRLKDRIASIPCNHILLAIDACFSGTFDRRIALGRMEDQVKVYVERGLQYKSRLYLTSGGKEYVSDGSSHSPFTRALLSTLRLDENGLITFPELVSQMDYVRPSPRYGEFEGNEAGGNFYFIGENANIPTAIDGPFQRPTPSRSEVQLRTNTNSDRNGNTYQTMADRKVWMTQNLNVDIPDSYCYKGKAINCDKYGRLYTFEAAKAGCKTLGAGWRLPTDPEWREMAKQYGGADDDASDGGKAAYQALIKGGSSDFAALLGGLRGSNGSFYYLETSGFYWSRTEEDSDGAWYYNFNSDDGELVRFYDYKTSARSVRCIKD